MTEAPSTSASARQWQTVTLVAVLPGVIHFLLLALAMAGIVDPAVWVAEHLLAGPWSIPMLWLFVIGGPLISVLTSLTLELQQGKACSFGGAWGMFGWAMLILGLVTSLPLPWILVFENN